MNKQGQNADTNKNTKKDLNWKGMVKKVSVKQRIIVILGMLAIVLIAAGLIIYSVTNAQNYEGIFVNGVRQVLY